MKIAVITLPLHTNYGGILQAYALKSVLESYGHQVSVVEPGYKMPLPLWWKAPAIYLKRFLQRMVRGSAGPEVFREIRARKEFPILSVNTSQFVDTYISPVIVKDYDHICKNTGGAGNDFDAFVVGSDQVWRPKYFGDIKQAFLHFAKNRDVLRFSYAASFGTDTLEYDYQQLEECSALLRLFDGVSVRESSAVRICDEWLDCDRAVQVLDPVMLLDSSAYLKLVSADDTYQGSSESGGIVTYFLDCQDSGSAVRFVEKALGSEVRDISVPRYSKDVPASQRVVPPLEQWIASISNAGFVITDSFHVCVLSILFHKPFFVIGNQARGLSRINSLLGMFGLESRLVQGIDPEDDGEGWLLDIDWESVETILNEKRRESFEFIESCLSLRHS